MLKVTPIFSGSNGNSTLIQSAESNVLLDVGGSYKALVARLAKCGLTPLDISAIVVTHEHSDHVSALKTWAKHFNTKVYAPKNCTNSIFAFSLCPNLVDVTENFAFRDLFVNVYECSHDSRQCFGYRFDDGETCVASVTDTGFARPELVKFLAPCKTVILESNHDVDMLWNGSYPYALKCRIASELGHLSNDQAAEVATQLLHTNVQNLVLAHLSQHNNTKQAALSTVSSALERCGATVGKDISLFVALQTDNEVTL